MITLLVTALMLSFNEDSDQENSGHSVLPMLIHDNPIDSDLHEYIDYLNL